VRGAAPRLAPIDRAALWPWLRRAGIYGAAALFVAVAAAAATHSRMAGNARALRQDVDSLKVGLLASRQEAATLRLERGNLTSALAAARADAARAPAASKPSLGSYVHSPLTGASLAGIPIGAAAALGLDRLGKWGRRKLRARRVVPPATAVGAALTFPADTFNATTRYRTELEAERTVIAANMRADEENRALVVARDEAQRQAELAHREAPSEERGRRRAGGSEDGGLHGEIRVPVGAAAGTAAVAALVDERRRRRAHRETEAPVGAAGTGAGAALAGEATTAREARPRLGSGSPPSHVDAAQTEARPRLSSGSPPSQGAVAQTEERLPEHPENTHNWAETAINDVKALARNPVERQPPPPLLRGAQSVDDAVAEVQREWPAVAALLGGSPRLGAILDAIINHPASMAREQLVVGALRKARRAQTPDNITLETRELQERTASILSEIAAQAAASQPFADRATRAFTRVDEVAHGRCNVFTYEAWEDVANALMGAAPPSQDVLVKRLMNVACAECENLRTVPRKLACKIWLQREDIIRQLVDDSLRMEGWRPPASAPASSRASAESEVRRLAHCGDEVNPEIIEGFPVNVRHCAEKLLRPCPPKGSRKKACWNSEDPVEGNVETLENDDCVALSAWEGKRIYDKGRQHAPVQLCVSPDTLYGTWGKHKTRSQYAQERLQLDTHHLRRGAKLRDTPHGTELHDWFRSRRKDPSLAAHPALVMTEPERMARKIHHMSKFDWFRGSQPHVVRKKHFAGAAGGTAIYDPLNSHPPHIEYFERMTVPTLGTKHSPTKEEYMRAPYSFEENVAENAENADKTRAAISELSFATLYPECASLPEGGRQIQAAQRTPGETLWIEITKLGSEMSALQGDFERALQAVRDNRASALQEPLEDIAQHAPFLMRRYKNMRTRYEALDPADWEELHDAVPAFPTAPAWWSQPVGIAAREAAGVPQEGDRLWAAIVARAREGAT
jgi:hypothetical protein